MNNKEQYLLADIQFLPFEKGGKKILPPIMEEDYTYRPTFYFMDDKTKGFCSYILIGSYLINSIIGYQYKGVKIMFLRPEMIKEKAVINKEFILTEGPWAIAKGIITDISCL